MTVLVLTITGVVEAFQHLAESATTDELQLLALFAQELYGKVATCQENVSSWTVLANQSLHIVESLAGCSARCKSSSFDEQIKLILSFHEQIHLYYQENVREHPQIMRVLYAAKVRNKIKEFSEQLDCLWEAVMIDLSINIVKKLDNETDLLAAMYEDEARKQELLDRVASNLIIPVELDIMVGETIVSSQTHGGEEVSTLHEISEVIHTSMDQGEPDAVTARTRGNSTTDFRGVSVDDAEAATKCRKAAVDKALEIPQNKLADAKRNDKAFVWWQKAADEGAPVAQNKLGDCYYYGLGVSQDYTKAVEWWHKAASSGVAVAQNKLGDCYYHGRGVSQDYAKAAIWWHQAANQGVAVAQNKLGDCYYDGCGVSKENDKAFAWWHKAACRGHAVAQNKLGDCYFDGRGVSQDYVKAVVSWNKAANKRIAAAQNKLGDCYYEGVGVSQDYAKAVEWWHKAANKRVAVAQNKLGDCYHKGLGVSQNDAKAAFWWQKAADQGVAVAQNKLGDCYYHGRSVAQDYDQAVEWYRKAADQGIAVALRKLGDCYQHGRGVSRDDAKAVDYRKAAGQDDADANRALDDIWVPRTFSSDELSPQLS